MLYELSNEQVTTILKGLVTQPWLEVNQLINMFTSPAMTPAVTPKPKAKEAPYGLKKDGTPRARPGRPTKRSK